MKHEQLMQAINLVDTALTDYEGVLHDKGNKERQQMVEEFHGVFYSVTRKMLEEL